MIARFTADSAFRNQLDRILEIICRKLQLSPTQYALAENHYLAVGKWLEQEGSILAPYKPKIYPQGSLPMGTTNKPLQREEYDLDFIVELEIAWWEIHPRELLSKVEYRIQEHKDYASRMQCKNRCICLVYAHDFHLDIVPACSYPEQGYGQICIPDRETKGWRDSNPRQYLEWFNCKAKPLEYRIECAEPLPQQESLEEKPALKYAVQLFKRYRDVAFRAMPNLAPVSIVLSTLCATHYQGEASVAETIAGILGRLSASIAQHQGRRIPVWNPANNVSEDLGERWENPYAYQKFVAWIEEFRNLWQELSTTRGYPEISHVLERLFDEQPTKDAIREDAAQISQRRSADTLGIFPKSGILIGQTTPIKVPQNTFYGQ